MNPNNNLDCIYKLNFPFTCEIGLLKKRISRFNALIKSNKQVLNNEEPLDHPVL